jgi:hypothetical protein
VTLTDCSKDTALQGYCLGYTSILSSVLRSLLLLLIPPGGLHCTTLTFEGLADGTPVNNYYASDGLTFTQTIAFIDSDDGGTGDFGGEPSPSTAAFSIFGIIFDAPSGLTDFMSFHYTNPYGTTNVRVYSGQNLTGTWLADVLLPSTPLRGRPDPTGSSGPFEMVTIGFQDVAKSAAIVSRAQNGVYLDNLTVNLVPEPSSAWLCSIAVIVISSVSVRGRRRS